LHFIYREESSQIYLQTGFTTNLHFSFENSEKLKLKSQEILLRFFYCFFTKNTKIFSFSFFTVYKLNIPVGPAIFQRLLTHASVSLNSAEFCSVRRLLFRTNCID
jgi:hypothetical protein